MSILVFYQKLLALRHNNRALLDGEYVPLNQDDPNVMSYLRRYKDEAVLVVLNMSAQPQKVSFNLAAQGFTAPEAKTLLTSMSTVQLHATLSDLSMSPFSVYIGEVKKPAAEEAAGK